MFGMTVAAALPGDFPRAPFPSGAARGAGRVRRRLRGLLRELLGVGVVLADAAMRIGTAAMRKAPAAAAPAAQAPAAAGAAAPFRSGTFASAVTGKAAVLAAGFVERAMGWAAALRTRLSREQRALRSEEQRQKERLAAQRRRAASGGLDRARAGRGRGRGLPSLPWGEMAAAAGLDEPDEVRALGGWDAMGRMAEDGTLMKLALGAGKVPGKGSAWDVPKVKPDFAAIAGLSDQAVLAQICDDLGRAAALLERGVDQLLVRDIAREAAQVLGLKPEAAEEEEAAEAEAEVPPAPDDTG
jgi:hypothetical protein